MGFVREPYYDHRFVYLDEVEEMEATLGFQNFCETTVFRKILELSSE